MTFVKIEGADFVRDINSMGLSNTNMSEKNEYYAKVRLLQNQKEEINKVKSEMSNIKNDIGDIKALLQQLLEKGTNG